MDFYRLDCCFNLGFNKRLDMRNYYYLLLFSLIITSCKKESQDEHIDTFPAEVRESVRAFLKAGSDRGIRLDIKKIRHIKFVGEVPTQADEENCSIACYHHKDKSIYIDTSKYDYKVNQEQIIFHELGHGLLTRGHRNNELPNKDPASIMHYSATAYYKRYAEYKRDYYLNEMFNVSTDFPVWAN